jgi:hypothetical protein
METTSMKILIILSLLLLILVSGCNTLNTNLTTPIYTTTPARTLSLPTSTISISALTPNPTSLNILSSTVPPSQDIFSTLTFTDTPRPTLTPLATYEPTKAALFVKELLQNNAGCQLPCWWGLIPGQTTWDDAQQFLESFTYSYGIKGDPNNYQVAEFLIPYPEDMGTISYAFGFKKGILEDIFNIYFNDLTSSYNLNEILNNYDQPDDILVSAYYEPRYSDYMIDLAFFYLQKGILLEYYDSGSRIIGDKKQVCPQKATYPHISLWSPELKMTLGQASRRYLDTKNWPSYRSLQEATGMDIETFYNTFKNSQNSSCLELSTSDWPKY